MPPACASMREVPTGVCGNSPSSAAASLVRPEPHASPGYRALLPARTNRETIENATLGH